MTVGEQFRAFLSMNAAKFRMEYGWMRPWVYVLTLILRPVAQVVFFGLMARFITGQSDVSFQLIGNSVQVCSLASLYIVADALVTERYNGTLALMLLSPRSKFFLLAGRFWLLGLHGLVITGMALLVSGLGFGLHIADTNWGGLLLGLLVTTFATSALGVALGSVGLITTEVNFTGNVAAALLLALSGVNFPVESLPAFVRVVSYALPMTRGVSAARLAVAGGGPDLGPLLLGEFGIGLAWLAVGYVVFRWAESRARVAGTLDLY